MESKSNVTINTRVPQIETTSWWERERDKLLKLAEKHSPCYVYHLQTLSQKTDALLSLKSIDTLYYAVKANPHPAILKHLFTKGMGFECVSIDELKHIVSLFPNIDKHRLLFTPNFAPKKEYEFALSLGCDITIDNLYPLEHWFDLFRKKSIILRIDLGVGKGHHKYVCTGGNESKFGIPKDALSKVSQLIQRYGIHVVGLHAHSGSGILSPLHWRENASMLTTLIGSFPDVKIINLGGGLGIVEKPGQPPLDLNALDASLLPIKAAYPHVSFYLEPGRFVVAESGVILAKVTQCKEKGKVRFIGIETGMNSLLRPALYESYHDIVNLSEFYAKETRPANVVGPICESGDTLGYDRLLPETRENDVILIANTGAYGHCMSSYYNLRAPAQELILE